MKKVVYLVLAGVCEIALPYLGSQQNALGVVITSGNTAPVVPQGGTFQFTANVAVRWSLTPGSQGTIDANGLYVAPAKVPVKNAAGGCQILPNDSVFNTKIDTMPVHPQSALWLSQNVAGSLSFDDGTTGSINVVDSSSPGQILNFMYTPELNGTAWSVPDVTGAPNGWFRIENGWYSWEVSGLDRHASMINKDTCNVQSIYNYYPRGINGPPYANVNAQGGESYQAMGDTKMGGIDAAALPLVPLMLHDSEVLAGAVNHALRVTLPEVACNKFIWPAQGSACGSGIIPMGTRFRLKRSVYNSIYPTLSPLAKVLATQLADYGLLVADTGYHWQYTTAGEFHYPSVTAAKNELASAVHPQNDMEAVEESSLMVSPTSFATNVNNTIVVATDLATGQSDSRRVALQGATMGVEYPGSRTFLSGSSAVQLQAWVNGVKDKTLTWSMSPSLGTLSPTGVYTPPASVSGLQSTTVTVTSNADPTASATIQIAVLAAAGGIRIKAAGTNDYTDSQGRRWYGDQVAGRPLLGIAFDGNDYNLSTYGQPFNTPDRPLYWDVTGDGNDIIYRFTAPNGNYKITLKFAQWDAGDLRERINIDSQGQTLTRGWSLYEATGGVQYATVDLPLSVRVNDGSLYFAIRRDGTAKIAYKDAYRTIFGQGYGPQLAAFTIEPEGGGSPGTVAPPTNLTVVIR